MASIPKMLYMGTLPVANTIGYTTPVDKYAIIKSITLCNSGTVDRTFRLTIGTVVVAYDHTIKAGKTLIIDDINLFLLSGGTIQVSASGSVTALISGSESEYVPSEFSYKLNSGNIPTSNFSIFPSDSTADWIVKSLIITSQATADRPIYITLGGHYLLYGYVLKPYDTLIVPLPNIIIPKGLGLTASATAGGSGVIQYGLVTEKVVQ